MENNKAEFRAVIKFLTLEGVKPQEIFNRMNSVYKGKQPKLRAIYKWAAEYRHGRTSLEDDPRCGRPVDVTTDGKVAEIQALVMKDRLLTIDDIASEAGVSRGTVSTILHEKLNLQKVCCRWVLRNLSAVDCQKRVDMSHQLLDRHDENPEEFCYRLVTGDETWLHHWDPESKMESMQWKHKNSPTLTKFRTQRTAGKVMATIFWDVEGVLLIDYKPSDTSITGAYYANVLQSLRQAIKEKRRGKLARGVLLLHDNAPVHKAKVAQDAIQACGFEQLPHPPYSPDLAPSDYYLFRHLKKHLRGTRFSDDEDLQWATEDWLRGQPEEFYFHGITSVAEKWRKCIAKEGCYIEK